MGGFGGGIPNFGYFKKKMKKDLVIGEKGVISTYETRIHFQKPQTPQTMTFPNQPHEITNEKAFRNLIKDLDPILLALLRERVLTICEITANNSEEMVNSFIQPRFYVELNEVVQKHLGFDNE